MKANIYLEAQFWGSLLDAEVLIENKKITVWFPHPTKPNVKIRNLEGFPIEGNIDFTVRTWGKDGSYLLVVVKVDELPLSNIKCVNENGYGEKTFVISQASLV